MEIFSMIQGAMRDIAYYEKAQEVFSMTEESNSGKKNLEKVKKSITFQNISFSYPSNNREVLSCIDLEIEK